MAVREDVPSRISQRFVSIQYLRAFAAVIVVYEHAFSNHLAANWSAFKNFGLWGVDIFFVISGFVMGCSAAGSTSAARFWKNRFLRIVPMYWLATTVWIVARLIVPDRLNNADVNVASVLGSYLLIPHYHLVSTDKIWSILVPGWTLQLELFFYLILSVSLLVRPALRVNTTVPTLILLVVAGAAFAPQQAILKTYTNPLLLEFGAGLLLVRVLPALRRAHSGLCLGISILSVLAVASVGNTSAPIWIAHATSGLAAVALVSAAIGLETTVAARPSGGLLLVGDASYSLYLFHPVVTAIVAVAWVKMGMSAGKEWASAGFIAVACGLSVLAAVFIHRQVERRLLDKMRPLNARFSPYRSPEAAVAR